MSNVKPYWAKHPVQLRVFAALAIVTLPIWLPVAYLMVFHREVLTEVLIQYRDLYRAITLGAKA